MTDTAHVRRMLNGLREYYADKDGNKRVMNTTQIAVYSSALAKYSPEQLRDAAQTWVSKSKFFPALSDLLEILNPQADWPALTAQAWSSVEDAIRKGGVYRGAVFSQGAVGETVRQVFGTWATACSFEFDSPGWAIRRQAFLAIFPSLAKREYGPVTLRGLHANVEPYRAILVSGLEPVSTDRSLEGPSRADAKALLGEIQALAKVKSLAGSK